MTSTITTRQQLSTGAAIKAPCTAAVGTNIIQSGAQTVGGVSVGVTDPPTRVLCFGMTDTTKNGIYDVQNGAWTRSIDSNATGDFITGTIGIVTDGTYADQWWILTSSAGSTGWVLPDTDAMIFAVGIPTLPILGLSTGASLVGYTQGGPGSITENVQTALRDFVSVKNFGALGTWTDDTISINKSYVISDEPYFPDGNYLTSITATKKYWGPGKIFTLAGVPVTNFVKSKIKNTYLVVITGQSNAEGANNGGPNPANALVKVWNGSNNTWGSSDYTQAPFSLSTPNGNGGNNNVGLAFAHRLADEEAASVYVVYDAVGGVPISDWIGAGTASVRYAAIKSKIEAALATTEFTSIGKTTVDYLIWAQGEENALTDAFSTYQASFTTLDTQFRAETWMTSMTPILIMGMSGLHDRYEVGEAQIDYTKNSNCNCIYVNSKGLKTQYDISGGASDYTHWLGPSLWEGGYHRCWYALKERGFTSRYQPPPFAARATGKWRGEADAIAKFDNLVGYSCRIGGIGVTDTYTGNGVLKSFILTVQDGTISSVTLDGVTTAAYTIVGNAIVFTAAPINLAAIVVTYSQAINGPAATGSISWGYRCYADGNYTCSGGYLTRTDNGTNYTFQWGRSLLSNAAGDYGANFGFQNTLNNNYQLSAGRGHFPMHPGEACLGTFSKYYNVQSFNGDGATLIFTVNAFPNTSITGVSVYLNGVLQTTGFALSGTGNTVCTFVAAPLVGVGNVQVTFTHNNPVVMQVGIGTALGGSAANAITCRADGLVELNGNHTSDPTQNKEITFEYLDNTHVKMKMRGADGTVRFASIAIST